MTRWSEAELELKLAQRGRAVPSRSKYHNVKTVVDGMVFDSKREAARWCELKLEERVGHIDHLRRQVPFALTVNRMHVADYLADFVYYSEGMEVVEDVKGARTDVYRIKRKLMLAIHGIEIREVK